MAESATEVTLEPLDAGTVPAEVTRLYECAFPARERLDIPKMLEWGRGYRLLRDGDFCGLAFLRVLDDLVWLLFFAIGEECRCQGIGTSAFTALEAKYPGCRFIIDVEAENPSAPNPDERRRRNAFWKRLGFREAGFEFCWRGEEYAFWVKGSSLTRAEVRRFWSP